MLDVMTAFIEIHLSLMYESIDRNPILLKIYVATDINDRGTMAEGTNTLTKEYISYYTI
jgi:hypothetical protein